jgi:ABC-type Na+ efflux pump permease subunit
MSRNRQPSQAWTIARTDLHQFVQARDFWLPLSIVALLFFVIIPTFLLLILGTIKDVKLVNQLSDVVGSLPASLKHSVKGEKGPVQASYALAVYLFAPLAIIVPLTVSSAVGAHTIIGERERGSGEFLAHSPASTADIYLGKLLAALLPAYGTAAVGVVAYSVMVNLVLATGGTAFFPTGNWWIFVVWVIPPLLALAIALILSLSSRVSSGAAAQQASSLIALPIVILAYAVSERSLFGSPGLAWLVGALAWIGAALAVRRGARRLERERLLGV